MAGLEAGADDLEGEAVSCCVGIDVAALEGTVGQGYHHQFAGGEFFLEPKADLRVDFAAHAHQGNIADGHQAHADVAVGGRLVAGVVVLAALLVNALAAGYGNYGLGPLDDGIHLILGVVEHDFQSLESHSVTQHAHVLVLAVHHGLVQGNLRARHFLGTEVDGAHFGPFGKAYAFHLFRLLEEVGIGQLGILVSGSALAEDRHGILAEDFLYEGAGVAGIIGTHHTADEEIHRMHAVVHVHGDGYIFLIQETDDGEVFVGRGRPVGGLLPLLVFVIVVAVHVEVQRTLAKSHACRTGRCPGLLHGGYNSLLDLRLGRNVLRANACGAAAVRMGAGDDEILVGDTRKGRSLADGGVKVVAVGVHGHQGRGRVAVTGIDGPHIEFPADDVRGKLQIALLGRNIHFGRTGHQLLGRGRNGCQGQRKNQGQDLFHILLLFLGTKLS